MAPSRPPARVPLRVLPHRENYLSAISCLWIPCTEQQIALFLYAAEALVGDYLNGRILPTMLHTCVVQLVRARLAEGKMPVLDPILCQRIDEKAMMAEPVRPRVGPAGGAYRRPNS